MEFMMKVEFHTRIGIQFPSVILETDSESAYRVLADNLTVNPTDNTLIADCKHIINQFRNFKLMHVLREGNQCADFLANLAQSSRWGVSVLEFPPEDLKTLLEQDAMAVSFSRLR